MLAKQKEFFFAQNESLNSIKWRGKWCLVRMEWGEMMARWGEKTKTTKKNGVEHQKQTTSIDDVDLRVICVQCISETISIRSLTFLMCTIFVCNLVVNFK